MNTIMKMLWRKFVQISDLGNAGQIVYTRDLKLSITAQYSVHSVISDMCDIESTLFFVPVDCI